MSKQYFIMNNRENPHDGYKEVSEEFVKNYIKSFPDGERAYFINLGYAIIETTEKSYLDFYRDKARNKYLEKLDYQNGLMSYSALDTAEFKGSDIVKDTSEPLEDKIILSQMIEKLTEAINTLSEDEKEIIELFYFEELNEFDIAAIKGVSQQAISKRKKHILKKLSNYFK